MSDIQEKIDGLRARLEVMEAAKAGKQIQFRRHIQGRRWIDASSTNLNLLWEWNSYDYRVKPAEPVTITIFAVIDCDGDFHTYSTDRTEAEAHLQAMGENGAYSPYNLVELTGTYTPDA